MSGILRRSLRQAAGGTVKLGHTSFERRIHVDLTTEAHFERKEPRRRATRYQDTPELRDAWEEALRDHQVRAASPTS